MHIAEVTISRIVVILGVAAEADLMKEIAAQAHGLAGEVAAQVGFGVAGQVANLIEIGGDVEVRVFFLRQMESDLGRHRGRRSDRGPIRSGRRRGSFALLVVEAARRPAGVKRRQRQRGRQRNSGAVVHRFDGADTAKDRQLALTGQNLAARSARGGVGPGSVQYGEIEERAATTLAIYFQ